MVFLLPLAVAGLVGTAAFVKGRRDRFANDPQVQANRQAIYDHALNNVKDPAELRRLSSAFHGQGMTAEGNMLQKRAALQELPESVKEARREVFRKMMASTDVKKIHDVADAYESEGCTGVASNLRTYAAGLAAAEGTEGDSIDDHS